MSTLRLVACVAAVAASTATAAAGPLTLQSSLTRACAFTGNVVGNVGNQALVTYNVGTLGFSCNFATGADPQISMVTTHGTILSVPGEPNSDVPYSIRWTVLSNLFSSLAFAGTVGPVSVVKAPVPNQVRNGTVDVRLLDNMVVGGNYTDTVTFTVTP